MAAQTRIYTICNNASGTSRLVRASHPSHALTHVARSDYSVRVATQQDLEDMLPAGVQVETIRHEQGDPPTD